MNTIVNALKTIWQHTSYRWLSSFAFIAFLILYLFTLPSAFTGGQISLMTLEYLDVSMVLLSISMAILVALIISLMVWLIRQGQKSSKASATSGVLVGVFTPLLCCSPLIPILFGSMASLLPSFIGRSGPLFQGFIATHQTELFAFAILLLVLALYQNAKKIVNGQACQA